jgi:hypothetical protein
VRDGSAHLRVFECPTTAAAKADAVCYRGGQKRCPGADIDIDHAAPPLLYLAGPILVLSVGNTSTALQFLASALGPPVAEEH